MLIAHKTKFWVPTAENKKSELFSYREKVRIFILWCTKKNQYTLYTGFSFCLHDGRGSNKAAAHSAASNQPSGLLLSLRVPTARNVYRGSCKSKDFTAFLFLRQRLHTLAHFLHTLQKSHELFALLAQRVFRCTKKRILREKHPRQLAAFFCVHLPDGFKDHFACDFCCRRHFVFRGCLRCCSCCVLPVEVGFDLLCQLQPGLVLRVSVRRVTKFRLRNLKSKIS